MTTDQVPKGLALLKGFSVFNPSEAFIEDFKQVWEIRPSVLEDDEKLLWMGSPDFRYSIISFCSYTFYFFILQYFLIDLYLTTAGNNAKTAFHFVFAFFIFVYFVAISKHSSSFFGVVYAVTNKRIFILYAFNTPKILSFFSKKNLTVLSDGFFTSKNIENGNLYYDLGYLYKIDVIILLGGNIGTLIFESSIDSWLQLTRQHETGLKPIKIKRGIVLQNIRNSASPFNRFVAIHNAEKVVLLIDSLRNSRIYLQSKFKVKI